MDRLKIKAITIEFDIFLHIPDTEQYSNKSIKEIAQIISFTIDHFKTDKTVTVNVCIQSHG